MSEMETNEEIQKELKGLEDSAERLISITKTLIGITEEHNGWVYRNTRTFFWTTNLLLLYIALKLGGVS
jgi:hypothetical protein